MNLPNLVPKSNCRVVKFSFYSHSKFTHSHPTHFSFCLRDGEFYFIICCLLLRDTHATSKKRVQFSRFSTPLVQLCPTFFHPLDLGRPISNDPPSPPLASPNDNQSIKRRYNSRTTIIWSFIKVGFRFQYQLINLVWLSIGFFPFSWSQTRNQNNFKELKTSFSSPSYSEKMCWGQCWAEASLSAFSWLYIFLCAVVQKYHEMLFLFIIIHIFCTHFGINVFYLHNLKANKLWNNNRTVYVNERIKTKTKSCHIQIEHAFYCLF